MERSSLASSIRPNSNDIIDCRRTRKPLAYKSDMGFILVPPDHSTVDGQDHHIIGEVLIPGQYPCRRRPVEDGPQNGVSWRAIQRRAGESTVIAVEPVKGHAYTSSTSRKTAEGWTAEQAVNFVKRTVATVGWTSNRCCGPCRSSCSQSLSELERGIVGHAMRSQSQLGRADVYPPHVVQQQDRPQPPRRRKRFRAAPGFDVSGFSRHTQAVLKGQEMAVMATTVADWRLSVAPASRIKGLDELRRVKGRDSR